MNNPYYLENMQAQTYFNPEVKKIIFKNNIFQDLSGHNKENINFLNTTSENFIQGGFMAPKPLQQSTMTGFPGNLNQNLQPASYVFSNNIMNEIPRNYSVISENKVKFKTCK